MSVAHSEDLDLNHELFEAAVNGDTYEVKQSLKKGANINSKFSNSTALHEACKRLHEETVKVLLDNNADISALDGKSNTCLHAACEGGSVKIVDMLLKRNVSIHAVNDNLSSPLHIACKHGDIILTERLISAGCHIDAKDKNGSTPLHIVCAYGPEHVVDKLINLGCRVDVKDKNGETSFHVACRNLGPDVIDLFLKTNTHLDIKDKNGRTPLHAVCDRGEDELIKKLINARFRTDVMDKGGKKPLELKERFKSLSKKMSAIPEEIKNKGAKAEKIFQQALKRGSVRVFHIRIMIIGHFGVGKTTITKVLLRDIKDILKISSTDGIEIYVGRCRINLDNGEWEEISSDVRTGNVLGQKLQQLLFDERQRQCLDKKQSSKFTPPKLNIRKKKEKKTKKTESGCNMQVLYSSSSGGDSQWCSGESGNDVKSRSDLSPEDLTPFTPNTHALLSVATADDSSKDFAENYCDVEIWDFGGQSAFYTTHQAFLSPRCIYPLVIDGSKDFDDDIDDETLIPGVGTSRKAKEYFRFWVKSIITYSKGKIDGYPKIIPIITHLDCIPKDRREERIKHLFEQMRQICTENNLENHIIFDYRLSMNATEPTSDAYKILRTVILETAKLYPTWGENMPATWVPLEHALLTIKAAGYKVLPVAHLQTVNTNNDFNTMELEELMSFLDFQHSLGTVLYFSDKELRDNIILHPKWLIDALRSLITADRFYKGDGTKEKMLEDLSKRGIAQHELIKDLWHRKDYKEFDSNADHLLKTMEKMDLLSVPISYDDNGKLIKEKKYLVPSMVKDDPGNVLINQLAPPDTSHSIFFTFEGRFLPKPIFNRLAASCVNMWPVEVFNEKLVLFSGFCCFRIDSFHKMTLKMLQYQIELSINSKNNYISKTLCTKLRYFVTQELSRICQMHRQSDQKDGVFSSKFKLQILCCKQHENCFLDVDESKSEMNLVCAHHEYGEQHFKEILFSSSKEVGLYGPIKTSFSLTIETHISKDSVPVHNQDLTADFTNKVDLDESCDSKRNPCFDKESTKLTLKELGRLSRRLSGDSLNLSCLFESLNKRVHDGIRREYPEGTRGVYEQYFRLLLKANATELSLQNLGKNLKICNQEHALCQVVRRRNAVVKSSLKVEYLEKKPSEEFIDNLSNRLDHKQAFQLFLELGIDVTTIDRKRVDFRTVLEQIREILKEWLQKTDPKPTFGFLEKSIIEADIHIDLLKKIAPDIFSLSV